MQALYDFPVEMQPVFLKESNPLKGARAIVRTDTGAAMGLVSSKYRLITHKQALDKVEPFTRALGNPATNHYLEKGGARLVSRFTYRDRIVSIPTVGDTVALRIEVINSYDGSEPLQLNMGAMVLRCLNGMSVMNEGISLRIRHIGNEGSDDLILPDPEMLWEKFVKKSNTWTNWTARPSSADYVDRVLKRLIASAVVGTKYTDLNRPKLEQSPTIWDFYDKLTYSITHEMPRIRESERSRRLKMLDFTFETTPSTA